MTTPTKAALDAARRFNAEHGGCCDTTLATAFDAFAASQTAELLGALGNINRKASPDPERTMSEASNDLYWCACEARQAIAKAKGTQP